VQTEAMIEMLPPWVPERRALVYLTGLAEVLAAIGLFSNRWRQASAIAAASMLVVFFPANIYAAVNAVGMGGHTWGPIYLLIRVPLQLLLLAVALAILDRFPVGRGRDRRQ
jgi:uncharacterized membrane protein